MVGRAAELLPWSENFAVGHVEFDAQHRGLVKLINEIADAALAEKHPGQIATLLKTIREAAEEHLRQENALLWEIRCGAYAPLRGHAGTSQVLKLMAAAAFDKHMTEHAALLDRLDAARNAPVDRLCETLRDWFVDHAIKHNSYLKAIFQAA